MPLLFIAERFVAIPASSGRAHLGVLGRTLSDKSCAFFAGRPSRARNEIAPKGKTDKLRGGKTIYDDGRYLPYLTSRVWFSTLDKNSYRDYSYREDSAGGLSKRPRLSRVTIDHRLPRLNGSHFSHVMKEAVDDVALRRRVVNSPIRVHRTRHALSNPGPPTDH